MAGDIPSRSDPSTTVFRHNEESWGAVWADVGRETGTQWRAKAELREAEGWTRGLGKEEARGGGDRMMIFEAERV